MLEPQEQDKNLVKQLRNQITELEHENTRLKNAELAFPPGRGLEGHLLEATARAAHALLTVEDFDQSVRTSLRIIGEVLDADRANIIENFDHPSNPSFPGWRVSGYEWASPGTMLQFSDPNTAQGIYEDVQWAYELLKVGQTVSYRIEEAPEPFRSEQVAIGVKSTHLVPIFVEGRWWGVLGLDDCREPKLRTDAELAALKIIASCIGSAIQRQRSQQTLLAAEQAQVAGLAKKNEELQQHEREIQRSYHLLSVVAQVTKDLLEAEDINIAIPAALQAVGEVASISRVLLLLQCQDPITQKPQHAVIYEWAAEGITAQINHPHLAVVDDRHVEVLVRELHAGRSVWQEVSQFGDEIRIPFESLGIQCTGAVPIFIEGRYVGCVNFDDCVAPRQWSQQEIDVLTAAAESIGAALHRKQLVDRLVLERVRAAQERAAELAKANEVLKRSLTMLAAEPSLDKFLGYMLQTIADQLGDRSGGVYLFDEAGHLICMLLNYENGTLQQESQITHPMATLTRPPNAWKENYLPLLQQNQLLVHHGAEFDAPAYEPYRQYLRDRNIQTLLTVPMLFGEDFLGSITIRSTRYRDYLPEELELARALAQQATLATQLTRLAEQRRQRSLLEERARMARDIHDTLAQAFTGISLQSEAAKKLLPAHPELQANLDCIGNLARIGLSEARRSIHALRLEALENLDFPAALRRLLHQMTQRTTTRAVLTVEGMPSALSLDVEEHLLRIAQEGITNAIRHGHAHTITLQLLFEPTTVHLQIVDDGDGFDPNTLVLSGFGLLGMQERVDHLHGQLYVVSEPGRGTEITVSVPI